MQRYSRPKPGMFKEPPFEKYNITDEFLWSCAEKIAAELKDFDFENTEYNIYEDRVHEIVKRDYPNLDSFISEYGIGISSFQASFRNAIKFTILDKRKAILFAKQVRELAEKFDLPFFFVTQGASAYSNTGSKAVKAARESHIAWEKENGIDPEHNVIIF